MGLEMGLAMGLEMGQAMGLEMGQAKGSSDEIQVTTRAPISESYTAMPKEELLSINLRSPGACTCPQYKREGHFFPHLSFFETLSSSVISDLRIDEHQIHFHRGKRKVQGQEIFVLHCACELVKPRDRPERLVFRPANIPQMSLCIFL